MKLAICFFYFVACTLFIGTTSPAYARQDDPLAGYMPIETASGTLPSGVARVRLLNKSLFSNFGFTSNAERESAGIGISTNAAAVVLEYGFASRFTAALALPYVYQNKATFDRAAFARSEIHNTNYEKYREQFVEKLVRQGECTDRASCIMRFFDTRPGARSDSLPIDVNFRTTDTNENIVIPKDVPLKTSLSNLIVNAGEQKNGVTGLGDVQLAGRFRLTDDATEVWSSALTISLYLPTGKYAKVARAYRPTGRGFFESALEWGNDFKIVEGFVVSLAYGVQSALSDTTRERTLILDNTKFSDGHCDAKGEGNNGDGLCTPASPTSTLRREGLRHTLRAQSSFSPGVWTDAGRSFGLMGGLLYDLDSTLVVDAEKEARAEYYAAIASLTWSGLPGEPLIPLEVQLSYEEPFRGRNVLVAPRVFTLTLFGYMK